MIFGEITTSANVNYEQVIRDALRDIGYDAVEKGTCDVPYKVPRIRTLLSANFPHTNRS